LRLYVAGRINYDTVILVDRPLERGRKYVGKVLVEGFGGTGTNIAIAAARTGARDVHLFAAIGDDLAEKALAFLKSEGVNTEHVMIFRGSSGKALILVDNLGEPVVVTLPGVNNLLTPEHVPRDIGEADGVIVANVPLSVAKSITMQTTSSQAIFMDPGALWNPFELAEEVKGECFLLPNKREFDHHKNSASITDRCITIVKMGSQGSAAHIHSRRRIITMSSLPIEKLGMKIVSTSGCGDVFTGVFAEIYLESKSLEKALIYATIAAGLKTTKTLSYDSPKRTELEEAVEKYSKYLSVNETSF